MNEYPIRLPKKTVVISFTNKEILTAFECFNIVTDSCDIHSFESIVTVMTLLAVIKAFNIIIPQCALFFHT